MPEPVEAPEAAVPVWEPREGEYCRREFVGVTVRRGTGAAGEDTRTTVTINTEAEDRHGTIVDPSGARLANYNQNPVVLINHSFGLLAGRSSVGMRNGALVAHMDDGDWDLEDDEIAKWHRKVKKGLMRAASIGFIPLKVERELIDPEGDPYDYKNVRYRIAEWELLEWSFVSVPSNPEAVVTERQIGASPSDFQTLRQEIASLRALLSERTEQHDPSASPAPDAPAEEAGAVRSVDPDEDGPEPADSAEAQAPVEEAEEATPPAPTEPVRLIRVDLATLRHYQREIDEERKRNATLLAKRRLGRA